VDNGKDLAWCNHKAAIAECGQGYAGDSSIEQPLYVTKEDRGSLEKAIAHNPIQDGGRKRGSTRTQNLAKHC